MQKQINVYQSMGFVALGTLALLAVPFLAMQFTSEVQWGPADFVIMGLLLFGTGMLVVVSLALSQGRPFAYKAGMLITIGASFLMIWANLAVGLIGSGPNPGNLMYLGVLLVLAAGVYRARFRALHLEIAVIAVAIALALVIAIALMAGMHRYPGSSVLEIVGVNLLLTAPYLLAAACFRAAARHEVAAGE